MAENKEIREFERVEDAFEPIPLKDSSESQEREHYGYHTLMKEGRENIHDLIHSKGETWERARDEFSKKMGREMLSGDPAMHAFKGWEKGDENHASHSLKDTNPEDK